MRQALDTKSVKASAIIRTGCSLPGFDTPSVCSHVCLWCGTQKEARGEKQRKGETQKREGRRGFTRWPLGWERTALNRTGKLNPFSSLCQERRIVLGKCSAPAVLCFQWNQQQSSLDFKGNWIRPMSRAFRSPTLKLSTHKSSWRKADSPADVLAQALETSIQGTAPGWAPTSEFTLLNKPDLAQFSTLSKFGCEKSLGRWQRNCQERLLGESNSTQCQDMVPPAPKGCSIQHPAFLGGRLPWNKQYYREKSVKT